MAMQVPIRPARRRKPKLSDKVKFSSISPLEKSKPLSRPSEQMSDKEEKARPSAAKGLAQAAMAMPGRGKAGRILKASLAGAAAGAEIEATYHEYKKGRAKTKAKKATTTVTQSAMAQKAKYHKKDPTNTRRT